MKAIVTVIGKDKPGIIAKVATTLAANDVNIEDISQTVVQSNFTMIMLCDLDGSKLNLTALQDALKKTGEEAGVSIMAQHEDVFNVMHKI